MIVVINSGSSSIKFAAYAGGPGHVTASDCLLRGEVEDLGALAHLTVRGPDGTSMADETWPERIASPGGHATALRCLRAGKHVHQRCVRLP